MSTPDPAHIDAVARVEERIERITRQTIERLEANLGRSLTAKESERAREIASTLYPAVREGLLGTSAPQPLTGDERACLVCKSESPTVRLHPCTEREAKGQRLPWHDPFIKEMQR